MPSQFGFEIVNHVHIPCPLPKEEATVPALLVRLNGKLLLSELFCSMQTQKLLF